MNAELRSVKTNAEQTLADASKAAIAALRTLGEVLRGG